MQVVLRVHVRVELRPTLVVVVGVGLDAPLGENLQHLVLGDVLVLRADLLEEHLVARFPLPVSRAFAAAGAPSRVDARERDEGEKQAHGRVETEDRLEGVKRDVHSRYVESAAGRGQVAYPYLNERVPFGAPAACAIGK